MDVERERLTNIVQRVFGAGASLGGSIGSRRYPGCLTISVDGVPWGSGRTLQDALTVATRRAAALVTGTEHAVADTRQRR
ncbi:MAG: hypothetical protein NTY19_24100 [Planctomycetota bacterium]|nr:hypothetical protein [Planctomycetota bacterium]